MFPSVSQSTLLAMGALNIVTVVQYTLGFLVTWEFGAGILEEAGKSKVALENPCKRGDTSNQSYNNDETKQWI